MSALVKGTGPDYLPRMRFPRWLGPTCPIVVSFVLGVAWHVVVTTPEPESDAQLYHWLGWALSGLGDVPARVIADGMAIRGWTQPAVMGALYALIGSPEASAFAWLQAVVFLPATTALVYVAGRFAFGRTVGIVAAWGFALWFPLVYHTSWLLPETTVGLVAAAALALLAAVVGRGGVRTAIALGAVLALLSLTHPAWQFVALATIVPLAVHFFVYDRPRIRLVAYAAGVALAILGPYGVVQVVADLPRAGEGGRGYGGGGAWAVWAGSHASTDFRPVADDYRFYELNTPGGLPRLARLIRSGELEVDEHLAAIVFEKARRSDAASLRVTDADYLDAGIDNLLADPGAWPEKVARGMETVFRPTPRLGPYEPPLAATWFLRPWRPLAGGVAALTVVGLAFVLARRRDRLVLFVPLLLQTAVFVAGVPEPRYGYALMSSVFLLASYAGVSVVVALRRVAPRRSREGADEDLDYGWAP